MEPRSRPRRPSWARRGAAAAVLLPVLATAAAAQDPAYSLGFAGPSVVRGEPGSTVRDTWFATLAGDAAAGATGADAWSLGITVTGGRIAGFGVAGTAAEPALAGGFARNEIVTWHGVDAAVSAVTLPAGMRLAPGTAHRVAAIELEAEPPADPLTRHIRLTHWDGVEGADGPVPALVRDGDREIVPDLGSFGVSAIAEETCARRALGFALENVESDVPFDGIVGGASAAGEVELFVNDGETGSLRVFPAIVSDAPDSGLSIQGWSLSIPIEGEADCVRAAFEGTAADAILQGEFTRAECVDPDLNGGRRGVVSAVVVTFEDFVLPPVGTFAALDVTLAADGLQGAEDRVARMRFEDGLRGSGEAVSNVLTVAGSTFRACNTFDASLTLRFRSDRFRPFLRGDANFDRKLDISDPISVLGHLFHGDTRIRCDDAGDANDDGRINIADASFLLGHLFRGSREPPPPFPDAGVDPTPDGLRCRPDGTAGTGI